MTSRTNAYHVPVDLMRWSCDPESLKLEGTQDVTRVTDEVIAQERAISALKFGMRMSGTDYNIFVAGEPQTGLTYLTRSFLEEAARNEPRPPDWCYVHNFREPDKPRAISLAGGMGQQLAKDMAELLADLKSEIPDLFESDDYRHRKDEIIKKFTVERNEVLGELEQTVNQEGFILNMSQVGMMIVPAKDGQPMTEETLQELTDEQKGELKKKSELLQEEMNATVLKIKRMEKNLKNKLKELDRRVALHAVGYLIDDLQEKYDGQVQVLNYLKEVKADIVRNLDDFKQKEQPPTPFPMPTQEADFTRYSVNVLIDHAESQGAPVVYEVNPTYNNLFGMMERKSSFGALFTDFTMIRPGSMHRANGGYLVINAMDLLKWYISWEALKRALKNKEIMIEDAAEMFGFIGAKGMKPEPIPLKVKIILTGQPYIYYLLYTYDDQFKKLFKVKAHLDDQVERKQEEIEKYIVFAARVVQEEKIRHVDKTGLSRFVEYGVELAGRQKKLTLKMALLRDILREADFWAEEEKSDRISREHVDKAIRQKKFRSSLPEYKIQEFILDGYVNVDTSGSKVGQINGLSVYDLGDYAFGRPSRITATVALGRQGVVAIDRESKLSGNIHTKGVLIMEGYLKSRYAADRPLSLSASLVFEQSYGMVDGDSASGAELFVLLSRLADVPLRQDVAVTGAVSQQGEIQPIGGVNEKIEGFFEVCRARGFTGEQGVIIPRANIPDLMLKGQVIEAVKQGHFAIHAVDHVDQALEILTDMPAGERDADGHYPEHTFNRLVDERLTELHEKARRWLKDGEENAGSREENDSGCGACRG